MNEGNIYNELSSKIKDIYIEIKDYKFIHGPLEGEQLEKRFLGRDKLIEKLKSILENSETKSGAYLITGYRGMGKTSFINKIIYDLSFENFKAKNQVIILIAFLGASMGFLLSLLTTKDNLTTQGNIISTISMLLLALFIATFNFSKNILHIHCKTSNSKYKSLLSLINFTIYGAIINSNLILIISSFTVIHLTWKIIITFSIFITYIFIGILTTNFPQHPDKDKINSLKKFWQYIKKNIKEYINHSQRVFIKINLGHEKIDDYEVFKLIVRSLRREYEKFVNSFLNSYIKKIFVWITLLITVSILINHAYINRYAKFLKNDTKIYEYIPSLNDVILNNPKINQTPILNVITKDLGDKFSYQTYIETIKILQKANNIDAKTIKNAATKAIETTNVSDVSAFKKLLAYIDLGIYKLLSPTGMTNPYLYIFALIFFWQFLKIITKLKIINLTTSRTILKRLSDLEEMFYAEITEDAQNTFSSDQSFLFIKFNRSRRKKYRNPDASEIEAQLLEILNTISNRTVFFNKADFVIIFDELDKIEGEKNEHKFSESSSIPEENSQKRKIAVMQLLSNMKYFLSNASAKFIFIAGREMFDASLADVSDRDFFIHSIFNEIFYLPSFLSYRENGSEYKSITSLTEKFIFKMLLGDKGKEYTIKEYNKFLVEYFKPSYSKPDENAQVIANLKREKIIITLRHFIIYLTHFSNGAPNKISSYFENFLQSIPDDQLPEDALIVKAKWGKLRSKEKSNKLYLVFDYYKQYQLALTNYLIKPIMLSITDEIKEYSDKLLVSTTFIIDHIFKYHKFSFSWRSLELTPEIFDINKTPELRGFIAQIIKYLKQSQLDEIISGLYTFKFPKRISNEISFLSKISEESAASFNFALDEYHLIKEQFQKMLDYYTKLYSAEKNKNYIHILSWLQATLGDLNFFEERYDEAVRNYLESTQYIRYFPIEEMTASQLIVLTQRMLKLGLALEHRNTYDTAFGAYSEIVKKIIEYRTIELEQLGLKEKTKLKDPQRIFTNKKRVHEKIINNVVLVKKDKNEDADDSEEIFNKEIIPEKLNINDNIQLSIDDFYENLTNRLTTKKENILIKLSAFEGIRVLYSALLAKFQIIEKSNLGGITLADIKRLLSEFNFIKKIIKQGENYLLISDFYKKIGDILFYKNAAISTENITFCQNKCADRREKQKRNGNRSHCSACAFYRESLSYLISTSIENNEKNKKNIECNFISILINSLEIKSFKSQRKNLYKSFGNILSDLGDTLYGCANLDDDLNQKFLKDFLKLIKNKDYKTINNNYKLNENDKELKHLEKVLLLYYLSSKFYKKATQYKESAYQLSKILNLLIDYISEESKKKERKDIIRELLPNIESTILSKIIKAIHASYNNSLLVEVSELKNILNTDEHIYNNTDINLNKLTISTDIDNSLMLMYDLKTSCYENDKDEEVKLYKSMIISPYSINTSMSNTILRLKNRAHINQKFIEEYYEPIANNDYLGRYIKKLARINNIDLKKIDKEFIYSINFLYKTLKYILNKQNEKNEYNFKKLAGSDYTHLKTIEFLIIDSIFANFKIIRLINIFGKSFMYNHSTLAYAHEKLMEWSERYNIYLYAYFLLNISPKQRELALKKLFKKSKKFSENILKHETKSGADKTKETRNSCRIYTLNIMIKRIRKLLENNDKTFQTNIKKDLTDLIGESNLKRIDKLYQCGKAKQEYYSVMETHTEGKVYMEMLEQMYFLNDDFNDRTFHFSVASERYKINTGYIKSKIDRHKLLLGGSTVFEPDSYINFYTKDDDESL